MNLDELNLLSQLIEAMDEAVKKLESGFNKRDIESFNKAKKEVLSFQTEISKLLGGGYGS